MDWRTTCYLLQGRRTGHVADSMPSVTMETTFHRHKRFIDNGLDGFNELLSDNMDNLDNFFATRRV